MDDHDTRVGGAVLFFLGGLAGTFFALRWASRGSRPTIERVHGMLDETVEGVETAAFYVRSLVQPLHELLDEADSLAAGLGRTMDSYRHLGSGGSWSSTPSAEEAVRSRAES